MKPKFTIKAMLFLMAIAAAFFAGYVVSQPRIKFLEAEAQLSRAQTQASRAESEAARAQALVAQNVANMGQAQVVGRKPSHELTQSCEC